MGHNNGDNANNNYQASYNLEQKWRNYVCEPNCHDKKMEVFIVCVLRMKMNFDI